jgi:hypothetical protein
VAEVGAPGILYSPASPSSDDKLGSVLFFPIYTSDVTSPVQQNTRINITNADQRRATNIHLFFVDGTSCGVADMTLCLTPNQTISFSVWEFDPGTTGYLIAVAVNSLGCPTAFNALMGDEYVKFASGHQANLAAESVAGLSGLLTSPPCDDTSFLAQIRFDGIHYNRLGRALAMSSIPSRADGNDTRLILNRIGGDLTTGAARLGPIFGIVYNDQENAYSFNFTPGACQLIGTLSNSFPRTVPRIEQIIPTSHSGWLKLWAFEEEALFGAVLNFNRDAAAASSAYMHGRNLHKLTTTATGVLTVPVFPPSC